MDMMGGMQAKRISGKSPDYSRYGRFDQNRIDEESQHDLRVKDSSTKLSIIPEIP
jgi:hypothetical protein